MYRCNSYLSLQMTHLYKSRKYPIWCLQFDEPYFMCMSLLRMIEYNESPMFKDKVFDLEEYMDWYASTTPSKHFTYTTDWVGFNLPVNRLKEFRSKFKDLSRKEKALLDALDIYHVFDYNNGYVIAYSKKNQGYESTLQHELVHALYGCDKKYRDTVNSLLEKHDLSDMKHYLIVLGYHEDVCLDETNAYFSVDFRVKDDHFTCEEILLSEKYKDLCDELANLYKSNPVEIDFEPCTC